MADQYCTQADALRFAPELNDSRLGEIDNDAWTGLIEEATLFVQGQLQTRYFIANISTSPVPTPIRDWTACMVAHLALDRYGAGGGLESRLDMIKAQCQKYIMQARNGSLVGLTPDYSPSARAVASS